MTSVAVLLINAAIISASILGAFILWQNKYAKGMSVFMFAVACAAILNIFESIGIIDGFALPTPALQLLWGPLLLVACKLLTLGTFFKKEYVHFLPFIVALPIAGHANTIIALGSISRTIYAIITARIIYKYMRKLEAERSDSIEFTIEWLLWTVLVLAVFNLFDLIRLNMQSYISVDINLAGQAMNNLLWLLAIMFITYKFSTQARLPIIELPTPQPSTTSENPEDFKAIYQEVLNKTQAQALYRQERITIIELSNSLGLLTRDVSRAINLVGGKSFNDFINELRIAFVCDVIANNDNKSLADISLEAGFSSKASFNRIFKKVKGQTPTQFRKSIES